ncbi:MAG: lysophospholipid acyltransferase family protein [Bacteroidia bacterium]
MEKIFTRPISYLYTAWVFLMFVFPLPLVLLVHIAVKPLEEKKRLRLIYRVHRIWIGLWEWFTGLHFQVNEHHRVLPDQAYVFVVNHCNLLDILMVGSCIQHPWKSLAKKEILAIPFVGWLIGQIAVMVDRSNRESRKASVLHMIRELRKGISILVFPEGTRNRTGEPLKSFQQGAFSVAISAQVPIVPVIITETRPMQPVDSLTFKPGKGHITFLPPVSTQGYSEHEVNRLMEEVKTMMETFILSHDPWFAQAPQNIKSV